MANLDPIDFKVSLYIKVNVMTGKMTIDWHRIGQMPFWRVSWIIK